MEVFVLFLKHFLKPGLQESCSGLGMEPDLSHRSIALTKKAWPLSRVDSFSRLTCVGQS